MEELNKYEKARILGARALQLSMGAPFLVKVSDEDLQSMRFNPLEIAKRELVAGVIPISIRRKGIDMRAVHEAGKSPSEEKKAAS